MPQIFLGSSVQRWVKQLPRAFSLLVILLTLLLVNLHAVSSGPQAVMSQVFPAAGVRGSPELLEASVLPEGGSMTALAIHPLQPALLFAGTSGAGVAISRTGGQQWQMVDTGLPAGADLQQIIPDPQHPDIVYAIATPATVSSDTSAIPATDLFKSLNGGQSWHALGGSLPDPHVTAFAIDPVAPTTLYAATFNGLYRSLDGGVRWVAINTGIANISINSIAIDSVNRRRLWLATGSGVYTSLDSGDHWLTPAADSQFYANMVLLKPGSPNVLFAATFGGVEVSHDGGLTWIARNSGLVSPSIFALALSAAAPQTIYAATAGGLFVSHDSGQDWSIAAFVGRPVRTVAVDPAQAGVAYSGSVDGGGVVVTHDSGQTWMAINHGLHAVNLARLVVIPGSRIVFGSSPGDGIFRSLDGGQTWTSSPPQVSVVVSPETAEAEALIAGAVPGQIFAALTPRLSAASAVVRSDDSGTSWTATVVPGQTIEFLAVDPYNPRHLYASGRGGAELLYSDDAGATWKPGTAPVGAATSVTALLADPWQAGRAYAAVADAAGQAFSLLVTADGGASWRDRAAGLPLGPNHHAITALTANPLQAGVLYALSDGLYQSMTSGSNWRLAATFTNATATTTTVLTPTRIVGASRVALPASVGLLATTNGLFTAIGANVWHSGDEAVSWTLVGHIPSGRPIRSLAALPDGTLILATDGQIWRLPVALAPQPVTTATGIPTPAITSTVGAAAQGADLTTAWYLADPGLPLTTTTVPTRPAAAPTSTAVSSGSTDAVVALLNPEDQLRHGQVFVQAGQTRHTLAVPVPPRRIIVTHVALPQPDIHRGVGPQVAALSATSTALVGIRGVSDLFSVVPATGGCPLSAATIGRQWYVLTPGGPAARLLIINPMTTTATLDIWLSDGTHVQRQRPVQLNTDQRIGVSLDHFSAATMVAAVVHVISPPGSGVLLESLGSAATGVSNHFGMQEPSSSWLYTVADPPPSGASVTGAVIVHTVTIFDPGPLTAQATITLYDGHGGPPQVVQVEVRPFSVSSLSLGLPQGVAVLGIASTVPLVATVDRRVGLPVAHNQWIIPVATTTVPSRSTITVIVFNPEARVTTVRLSLLDSQLVRALNVPALQERAIQVPVPHTHAGWQAIVAQATEPVLVWRAVATSMTKGAVARSCPTLVPGIVIS